MVAQIDKILLAERDGKATIQIVPFEYGAHAAEDSNFVLLEFDDTTKMIADSVCRGSGMQSVSGAQD